MADDDQRGGAVTPAKAGMRCEDFRTCTANGLDSRFRGNDWCRETGCTPNGPLSQIPRAVVPRWKSELRNVAWAGRKWLS
jgi:hypothetical protein